MAKRGRRKGSKNKATVRAEFDKELMREALRLEVRDHLGPMLEAQIANAKGIKYLVARERKGGKFVRLSELKVKAILEGKESEHEVIEVWEKDPSIQAFTDLMNRTIDKPADTVNNEQSGTITHIYKWGGE